MEDSNFFIVLPVQDFRNQVARESLRREFLPGSFATANISELISNPAKHTAFLACLSVYSISRVLCATN